MIDYDRLKLGSDGRLTIKSLLSFLFYCNSEERGYAFYDLIHDEELVKKYPMSWKTFYRGLTNAYDSGKMPASLAREMFDDTNLYCSWYALALKKDKDFFSAIPTDENGFVTLYRGCSKEEIEDGEIDGVSWTTNRGVAEFFAFRFDKKGVVVSTKLPLSYICGVLTDRSEDEVIITEYIDDFEIVTEEPTEHYKQYIEQKAA